MNDQTPSNAWVALIQALKDLRVSPRISLSAALVGAAFLGLTWAPDWFGIRTAIQSWRPWLLLITVAGTITFAVELSAGALERSRSTRRKRAKEAEWARTAANQARETREREKADLAEKLQFLKQMTVPERAICKSFVAGGRRSQTAYASEDVEELARRGVLIQISPGFVGGGRHDKQYSMADWAWNYLNTHKELLG